MGVCDGQSEMLHCLNNIPQISLQNKHKSNNVPLCQHIYVVFYLFYKYSKYSTPVSVQISDTRGSTGTSVLLTHFFLTVCCSKCRLNILTHCKFTGACSQEVRGFDFFLFIFSPGAPAKAAAGGSRRAPAAEQRQAGLSRASVAKRSLNPC